MADCINTPFIAVVDRKPIYAKHIEGRDTKKDNSPIIFQCCRIIGQSRLICGQAATLITSDAVSQRQNS